MNSLLIINLLIKQQEELIAYHKSLFGGTSFEEIVFKKNDEDLEKLQSIKADLEAWEVVRKRLKIGGFITMDSIPKDHTSYRTIEKVLRNDQENKMIIEDYPVIFNNDAGSQFVEKINREAFKEADISDVALKYNHNDNVFILARTRNGLGKR